MLGVSPELQKKIWVAVDKATDSHATPPKEKHVRTLIIESHSPEAARDAVALTFDSLSRRMHAGDPVVCLKSLVTLHRLFQEGSPLFLSKRHLRADFVERASSQWVGAAWGRGNGKLCTAMARLLAAKTQLHLKNPALPGDLSLERLQKVQPIASLTPDKACQLANGVVILQTRQLELVEAVLAMAKAHQLDDLKSSVLIPASVESYAAYTLLVRLLRHAAAETPDSEAAASPLGTLLTKFYVQFKELATFFWEAAQIRYVATTTTIPTLPEDPPAIEWPRRKKQQEASPPSPSPPQEPPKAAQEQWANFDAAFGPTQPQQQQQQQSTAQLLMFDAPLQPQQQPAVNPFLFPMQTAPAPVVAPRPSNPFADLLPTAQSMGLAFQPAPAPAPAPAPQPKVVTQVVTRVDTTEINRLKQRIAELERKVRELQDENSILRDRGRRAADELAVAQRELIREKEQCAGLQRALNDKSPVESALRDMEAMLAREKARATELERSMGSAQSAGRAAEERVAELARALEEERRARDAMQAESSRVAAELAAATNAWREERWARTSELASQGAAEIEAALAQLNSPSSLGNPDATVEDVLHDSNALKDASSAHLTAMASADEALRASGAQRGARAVPHALATLLFDAKGLASGMRKDQQAMRSALVGAAGKAGEASRLAVAASGTSAPHSADELARLQATLNESDAAMRAALSEVARAIAAAAATTQQDSAGIDERAERELLAAAAQIEALANQLREARAKKARDPGLAPGELDVDAAIMEAALAISQATSMLVTAAAGAQRDRVARGKASATAAKPYVANAVWSEGLVSAGQAVAGATHDLVGSANRAVQSKDKGDLSEEGLIAAAHGVASSTAQLVAATRSKSDAASAPSQERVEDAAKAVSRATALLVEAAKAVASSRQSDQRAQEDYSRLAANQFRVKEMEQQVLIHRLEKELTAARAQLGQMHRSQYRPQTGA